MQELTGCTISGQVFDHLLKISDPTTPTAAHAATAAGPFMLVS